MVATGTPTPRRPGQRAVLALGGVLALAVVVAQARASRSAYGAG
jgi:hypothetical protein